MGRICAGALWVAAMAAPLGCGDRNATPKDGKSGSATTGASAKARPLENSEQAALDIIRAAGDRAALLMAFYPEKYAEDHRQLTALGMKLPGELRRALASVDSVESLLAAWMDGKIDPTALKGWDKARPTVLALAEAPEAGPPGYVASGPLEGREGLRHRIILPATDPQALLNSLADTLDKQSRGHTIGKEKVWEIYEGRWLSLQAAKDHVHGVMIVNGPQTLEARTKLGPVIVPIHAQAPVTPALVHAVTAESPVAFVVQPWNFRSASAWEGMGQAALAVGDADTLSPNMLDQLTVAARSIVLGSEALILDEGADFDAHALTFSVDDQQVAVQLVSALTPEGRTRWVSNTGGLPALKAGVEPFATFDVGLDGQTMLEASSLPPAFGGRLPRMRDISYAISECGWGCTAHFGLRHPTGVIKAIAQAVSKEAPVPLDLKGARVVVMPRGEAPVPPVAMAIEGTANGVEKLQALFKAAESDLNVKTASTKGRHWLLASFQADADAIFDLGQIEPAKDGHLLQSTVMAKKIAMGQDFSLLEMLTVNFERIDLSSTVQGPVMATQLVLSAAGKPAPTVDFATLGAHTWQSPIVTDEGTPTFKCASRVSRELAQGLKAMNNAAPDQRQMLVARALDAARSDLDCLKADPRMASVAYNLEGALLSVEIRQSQRQMNYAGMGRAIDRRCTDPKAQWCAPFMANYKALPAKLKQASPPVCDTHGDRESPVVRIAMLPDALFLNEQPTTLAALPEAVKALIPRHGDAEALILSDPEVQHGEVLKVLDVLQASKLKQRLLTIDETECPKPDEDPLKGGNGLGAGLAGIQHAEDPAEQQKKQPQIGKGAPTVMGALSKEVIQRVIRGSMNGFKYCYEKELAKNPSLAGKTTVKFTISGNGSVVKATAEGMPVVHTCMENRARALRFPAPKGGGIVIVKYPFIFKVDGAEKKDTVVPVVPKAAPGKAGSVHRTINAHMPLFKRCYLKALQRDPSLAGRVKVVFTVTPDGTVTEATSEGMNEVKGCMEATGKRVKFPAHSEGKPMKIAYPFIFTPG
ncbi:MAG: AgmX/PglI C-terminal domain-containing protein [Bradymonadia bacterium]